MSITYLIIGILLAIAVYFGFKSISSARENDITEQLRALLIARTEGKITEEEFLQIQSKLHATLMAPQVTQKNNNLIWGGFVIIIVAASGIYYWRTSTSTSNNTVTQNKLELPMAGPLDTQFGKTEAHQKPMNVGGDLNVMVKRLADKLVKNPKDGEGWLLLARTYNEINQPKDAAVAYAKAAALLPPDATLLADWANAHVMASGGKWDGEAKKIVQRALAADPKHLKTLSLAGTEAFGRADYKAAIEFWKRMQAAAEVGSMDAKLAESNIQEAEALRSGKKQAPSADSAGLSNAVRKAVP